MPSQTPFPLYDLNHELRHRFFREGKPGITRVDYENQMAMGGLTKTSRTGRYFNFLPNIVGI